MFQRLFRKEQAMHTIVVHYSNMNKDFEYEGKDEVQARDTYSKWMARYHADNDCIIMYVEWYRNGERYK